LDGREDLRIESRRRLPTWDAFVKATGLAIIVWETQAHRLGIGPGPSEIVLGVGLILLGLKQLVERAPLPGGKS
jgi:hypothetical protein